MRRIATLLLAGFSVTAAYAQAPNDRANEAQNEARGNRLSTQSSMHMHNRGVDREAAIGHALGMAIEGSSLWHCAKNVEAKEAKTDRKPDNNQAMRDPGVVLEQHARDAFRGSDTLFQAVMQDEQAGKSRGTGDAAENNRQGADHMAKHQACEEFYRAARDYSRALQVSCSNTKQAGGQTTASIGSEACAENSAQVALINHAVKEAVAGVALHQMLKHHGEHDRTTQALESHAEQMISSSRHAIDSIDKSGANDGQSSNGGRRPGAFQAANTENQNRLNKKEQGGDEGRNAQDTIRRDAARPNYNDEGGHSKLKDGEAITVRHLAKLGREVIHAVDRLNQNEDQMKK